jgi:atypical dual specificity phosphatase
MDSDRYSIKMLSTVPFADFPLQANEIIPRLYIADMHTATDPITLEHLHITHIMSVIKGLPITYPLRVQQTSLSISDHPWSNIGHHFDRAVNWIKSAMDADESARVLVHCMCGMSRSPSVVIAYLMGTQGMSLSASLAHVKARRAIVRPNFGFIEQLEEYERTLKESQGTVLVE